MWTYFTQYVPSYRILVENGTLHTLIEHLVNPVTSDVTFTSILRLTLSLLQRVLITSLFTTTIIHQRFILSILWSPNMIAQSQVQNEWTFYVRICLFIVKPSLGRTLLSFWKKKTSKKRGGTLIPRIKMANAVSIGNLRAQPGTCLRG